MEGVEFKRLREGMGVQAVELAERAGVTRKTVNVWERSEVVPGYAVAELEGMRAEWWKRVGARLSRPVV